MSQPTEGPARRLPAALLINSLCWLVMAAGLLLAVGVPVLGQPTFPSSGYLPILVDDEEPGVADNIDILSVGYQRDLTYAYFKITVQDGAGYEAGLASDRFYLYMDLDNDGLADRLLRNTSAANATLDFWVEATGSWWTLFEAWCEDPNDTPDDHVYLACYVSLIDDGDLDLLAAAAQDQPDFDDTIRDPNDDPNMDEVTGTNTSNPTAVVVSDFRVERSGKGLAFWWRAPADPWVAGFNVYALRGGKRTRVKLNSRLIPASPPLVECQYVFQCPAKGRRAASYELEVVDLDGTVAAMPWVQGRGLPSATIYRSEAGDP